MSKVMISIRQRLKKILSRVFNAQNAIAIAGNAIAIAGDIIDLLSAIAPVYAAVDRTPKGIAVCKAIEALKEIKDRNENPAEIAPSSGNIRKSK